MNLTLSVIIPAYNEENTVNEIISRVCKTGVVKEIICVNDGSTDSTGIILENIKANLPCAIEIIHNLSNKGKGFAIRKALETVKGELVIIQDADLEYDPGQYSELIKPFENENVKVVYGSRNILKNPKSSEAFYLGGIFLSKLTNFLYGSDLTDESTCYKVFRTSLLKELNLECLRFEFCPEVTSKVLRKKIRIHEVPVSYYPRSHDEGKKIKWHDGLTAIFTLIKYRFK